MGLCKYCGKDAGFFSHSHKECEEKHDQGVKALEDGIRNYFRDAIKTSDLMQLSQNLRQLNYLTDPDIAISSAKCIDEYTEHRLFSQISRVWSGAVFNSIEEACELASRTSTKTGLAVFTSINRRIYETKKVRDPLFESECKRHIVKDEFLPKWNYLVKYN